MSGDVAAIDPAVAAAQHDAHARELRREAFTMALYVAICLLAALTAIPDDDHSAVSVLALIWGTTIGLALAHWFAFRLSARLVGAGEYGLHDAESAAAQFTGAFAVALLSTVPVLIFPSSSELDAVRLVEAGFIALVGFAVARSSGAGMVRSLVYGGAMLTAATAVAAVKNALVGH